MTLSERLPTKNEPPKHEKHLTEVKALVKSCPSCGYSHDLAGACPGCGFVAQVPEFYVKGKTELDQNPEIRLKNDQIINAYYYLSKNGLPDIGSERITETERMYLTKALSLILQNLTPEMWMPLLQTWGVNTQRIDGEFSSGWVKSLVLTEHTRNVELMASFIISEVTSFGLPNLISLLQLVNNYWHQEAGSLQSDHLKRLYGLYLAAGSVLSQSTDQSALHAQIQEYLGSNREAEDSALATWVTRLSINSSRTAETIPLIANICPNCGKSFNLPGTCPSCSTYVEQSGHGKPDNYLAESNFPEISEDQIVQVLRRYKETTGESLLFEFSKAERQYLTTVLATILKTPGGIPGKVVLRRWGFPERFLSQIVIEDHVSYELQAEEIVKACEKLGTEAQILLLQMDNAHFGPGKGLQLRSRRLSQFLESIQNSAGANMQPATSLSAIGADAEFESWWSRLNDPLKKEQRNLVIENSTQMLCPNCGALVEATGSCNSCHSRLVPPRKGIQASEITHELPLSLTPDQVKKSLQEMAHLNPNFYAQVQEQPFSELQRSYLSQRLAIILSCTDAQMYTNLLNTWGLNPLEIDQNTVWDSSPQVLAESLVSRYETTPYLKILLLQLLNDYWGDDGLRTPTLQHMLEFVRRISSGASDLAPADGDDQEFENWWGSVSAQPEPELTDTSPPEVPEGFSRAQAYELISTYPELDFTTVIRTREEFQLLLGAFKKRLFPLNGDAARRAYFVSLGISAEICRLIDFTGAAHTIAVNSLFSIGSDRRSRPELGLKEFVVDRLMLLQAMGKIAEEDKFELSSQNQEMLQTISKLI